MNKERLDLHVTLLYKYIHTAHMVSANDNRDVTVLFELPGLLVGHPRLFRPSYKRHL